MKTLTTMTAIAALVAGISFAHAQNSATPNNTTPAQNSINAGSQTGTGGSQSGTQMNGNAAMKSNGTKSSGKVAVTGTSQFCIKDAGSSDGRNCKFTSMAACQKEAGPDLKKECGPNPNLSSTTGMKAK
jgi:hypothetical protein